MIIKHTLTLAHIPNYKNMLTIPKKRIHTSTREALFTSKENPFNIKKAF